MVGKVQSVVVGTQGLDINPYDHVVHFYDDEPELVADIAEYIGDGLRQGAPGVVIATADHRRAIEAALRQAGLDPTEATDAALYHSLDAADTLSALMVDGRPDRRRFGAVVGDLVASLPAGRPIRAFGEMVALLWADGDVNEAIELELLWNEQLANRGLSLYCAYPLASIAADRDLRATSQVCHHHTGVIPPRSYAHRGPDTDAIHELDERSALFVPVPSAVRAVRRFVTDTLAAWDAAALVDSAGLVVSELASNAVRHAGSPFRAVIRRTGPVVRIEVHDVSPVPPQHLDPPIDVPTGRGIQLVAALSRSWGSERLPDGKVVWAELAVTH